MFTPIVETVNVAVDCPAGTITVFATDAAELPLDRATETPPLGAAPDRLTEPEDDVPPCTVLGFSVSEASVAGVTVNVAVRG